MYDYYVHTLSLFANVYNIILTWSITLSAKHKFVLTTLQEIRLENFYKECDNASVPNIFISTYVKPIAKNAQLM